MSERDIFMAAVDLPGGEQAAYLDRACGADAGLRARVDGLLRSHDAAGSFLNEPAADPADAATVPFTPAAETDDEVPLGFLDPPGRPDSLGRLGHYDVLEVLGRGGFGVVFRAFDDRLQRVVAVKVLSPQMATTSPARKRFLREARSAAAVKHENVVTVHAVEEQPLPFLVMDYIPGETLQQRITRNGPVDLPEVLRVGRQVAAGLSAAHATGLIHRDIKPSNILLDTGPHPAAKITDFGLARAADDASLTRSGTVAGTPMYMSPEQARGEALDHRSDLFSLGSVLYALVTGRPPFRAETTLAVLKRVAEDTPRPIREVIPEVPEWFCRIVEKLHAKDPAERFQTAQEVADLLADCERQLADGNKLTDTSRIPAARAVPRRKRWPLLAGVGAALAAVLTLAVVFCQPLSLFVSGRGELVLEDVDPDFLVTIRQGEQVLRDGSTHREFVLPADDATELRFHSVRSEAFRTRVSIPRGGRVRVNVAAELAALEKLQRDAIDQDKLKRIGEAAQRYFDEMTGGFTPLFNGKDLSGWKTHPDQPGHWVVADGILRGDEPGYLFSDRNDYANFHLRVETRVSADGDSNIVFRAPYTLMKVGPKQEYFGTSTCYLANLHPSTFERKLRPTGSVARVPPPGGGFPPALALGPGKLITPNEWFTFEVIADGNRFVTKFDGREVATGTDPLDAYRAGHIALCAFSPGTVIEFRKIEIKELPAGAPAVPKTAAEFLPFVRGTWSRDGEVVEPKAEAKRVGGQVSFDTVAGGTLWRGLNVDEHAAPTSLILHRYDPEGGRLSSWYFGPDGVVTASDFGTYDPTTRLFAWQEKLPDGGQSAHHLTVVDGNTVTARHYDTDAAGKIVYESRGTFTRSTLAPVAPKLVIDPKRPTQMAALDRMVGEWRNEQTVTAGGQAKREAARVTARPILGGRFVEEVVTNDTTGVSDYTVAWFDTAVRAYRRWYFSGGGTVSQMTGTWDEAAKAMTWTSADKRSVAVEKFIGDDRSEFRITVKGEEGQTVSETTGVARRAVDGAAPKAVVLRTFDPAKDKPAPLWADAKPVTVEGGAWRIENDTNHGNFKVLFDTLLENVPKDGLIVFRAKVKVKANDKLTWGSLQLGVGDPAFHKYDWPDHLGTYRGDVPEWTQKEVRYPAGVFHEKTPPSVPVYVGLNANGVVWVKDAEVLHIPEGANPAPRPASKEPTKLRTFAPTTDTPTFGPNSDVKGVAVEDGGWRIESGTAGVKGFHAIFGSVVEDLPSSGLIVLRMLVKAKGNDKRSWGRVLLNFTDPDFHKYDWPKHLGEYRGDVPEWTPKEIRIPAEVFHKKTPPTLTASADFSDGVLWVKDVEVWHVPEGAKLDVLKAAPPDKR